MKHQTILGVVVVVFVFVGLCGADNNTAVEKVFQWRVEAHT